MTVVWNFGGWSFVQVIHRHACVCVCVCTRARIHTWCVSEWWLSRTRTTKMLSFKLHEQTNINSTMMVMGPLEQNDARVRQTGWTQCNSDKNFFCLFTFRLGTMGDEPKSSIPAGSGGSVKNDDAHTYTLDKVCHCPGTHGRQIQESSFQLKGFRNNPYTHEYSYDSIDAEFCV